MRLISENSGCRIYESEDGGFVEVRAEMRGRTLLTGKAAVDQYPELREHMVQTALQQLRADVAGLEVIEGSEQVTTEVELLWHYLEDENGEPLVDEDGEWIVDESQEPIEQLRFIAECGVWPVPR